MSEAPRAGAGAETARVQHIYDRLAPRYDALVTVAEKLLFRGGRRWATSRAQGRVLEVAVGTGRNLALFPPGVQLTGIELSPAMLERARRRARALGMAADLRQGDAQSLDLPDGGFDTVVATLSLCSIPDDVAAVREMARVLRPGGRLVLLDHVASSSPAVRLAQSALDPLLVRLEGDHLLRRPEVAVRDAGLVVEERHRSALGIVLRLTARKPDGP